MELRHRDLVTNRAIISVTIICWYITLSKSKLMQLVWWTIWTEALNAYYVPTTDYREYHAREYHADGKIKDEYNETK